MQTWQIVMIIVAILISAGIALAYYDRHRTNRLRSRFGPEYDRTVTQIGDRRRAESELTRREERLSRLDIRPLSVSDREKYLTEWKVCQAHFVDDPARAVTEADRLVTDVMEARG